MLASEKREKNTVYETIHVSRLVKKRNYDSFSQLNKEVNSVLEIKREEIINQILLKQGIQTSQYKTKRELYEALRGKKIEIVREKDEKEGTDIDCVYLDNKIIGEWDNTKRIRVNKNGKLVVKIKYLVL